MNPIIAEKYQTRFLSKVQKTAYCWNWTGSYTTNKRGIRYGQFWFAFEGQPRKNWKAHRFSYLLHCGEFDRNLKVCHECDNGLCVNPSHLFLGTQSDNMLDCSSKGRHVGNRVRHKKAMCPKGHPYAGDNLYLTPEGYRICKKCRRDGMRRYHRRVREDYNLDHGEGSGVERSQNGRQ